MQIFLVHAYCSCWHAIIFRYSKSQTYYVQIVLYSAPSACPGLLTVNHSLPTTAKLSWTPLPKEKQNGVIIGYTVQIVRPDSSSARDVIIETADATSTEISNLNPSTKYTFKISAKTKAGSGPAASISSQTPEGGESYMLVLCVSYSLYCLTLPLHT